MKKAFSVLMLVFACWVSNAAFAQGVVSGWVHEQDSITPVVGASVSFSGIGELGDTLAFQFFSDSLGFYQAGLELGVYQVKAVAEGYTEVLLPDSIVLENDADSLEISFVLNESYRPVSYVAARQLTDDFVRVSWSMRDPIVNEDFETGDFSLFRWNPAVSGSSWVIDSLHANSGRYCMKSGCEGQPGGVSSAEVAAYVPRDGTLRFFARVSSESLWDVGSFYMDGQRMMECSGVGEWLEFRFAVTEGEHVFRWSYQKDLQTDEEEDAFYVDDICFCEEALADRNAPMQPRSLVYYDLFRCRLDEEPVMLASHLSDTMFMEMNWNTLDWGQYRWGVSCFYEGNRGISDTVWSVLLDKEMTTVFDLDVTTNIGLTPAGALVRLSSVSENGHVYDAYLDDNGSAVLPNVYRDSYQVGIYLSGYEDFVSDDTISVFEPTHYEAELVEQVLGIDSLYVSSTGWMIWQLAEYQERGLQYFEIMLEDELVGTTTGNSYQLDVETLEAGRQYEVKVRPVYVSTVCDWIERQWLFLSCSDYQGTMEGLQWQLDENEIVISWESPQGEPILGAMLYRDGTLIGMMEGNVFHDDASVVQGAVEYGLRLVYGGNPDGTYFSMSCMETVVVSLPAYCDPPTKLEGENYYESDSDYGALISWGDRPPVVQEWLHYDDGQYRNSIGNGEEPVLFWAIRFDADDLVDYQGTELKKIAIFDVSAGTYQMWVYVGGEEAPQTMVRYQNMNLTGGNQWYEQAIDPLEIPENESVWIVVGQQGLNRPAAACADMGDPDGRWVSMDGTEWRDMQYYNVHYTWMLRAFVSNQLGRQVPLQREGFSLQRYQLYRSFDNVEYQQIASIPEVDGQAFYQYRDVLVNTPFHGFYYRLTAVYLSEDGEVCDSDYATSLYNPDHQYVWVDDNWSVADNLENDLRVYPNPARESLFIEAKAMKSWAVFNALGQCVMEAETQAEATSVSLSGLENGLYLLRVGTDLATLTRRFVVAR